MPAPVPSARLLGLATAVPAHALRQDDIKAWARELFNGRTSDIDRLLPAFDNAGIETRYSCMPLGWHGSSHGWLERNRQYVDNAVELLSRAATDCLDAAGVGPSDVDAVVAVSTSGFATPSLDALVMERMNLRRDAARLPVFGLGCAGGVVGLARAAEMARAVPGRRVLFLVAELCGLTFRDRDSSKSNVIATVLFGDGAAAALLVADSDDGRQPRLSRAAEHTWPDSLDVMGWHIEDDGFGVLFSQDIPSLVTREMPAVLDAYLTGNGLTLADYDGFVCHPGGAKVVAALEQVFGLAAGGLDHTRGVLRDYGNMSAATVMFVLDRFIADRRPGRYMISALGPGFSVGFLTLEIP
jgi:alkylresorcinol/alkylpyrone synthase